MKICCKEHKFADCIASMYNFAENMRYPIKENPMNKKLKILMFAAVAVFMLSSCAKDKNDTPNLPGYKIIEYGEISQNVQEPCFINIMFQVTDMQGDGVSTLSTSDFEVLENDQPVSPTESAMQIRKQDVVPYSLKTVLLIDNSFSVGDNLEEIKNAAKNLVLSKLPNQQFALFVFSENPVLLQGFTDNTQDLTAAIDNISLGSASTNLYGSIAEAVDEWEDFYETDQIQQGFLVGFTDGSDTQASSTLEEALVARGNKKVFMVGLGDEIEPAVLEDIGNAGYFPIDDVSELTDRFEEIQDEMAGFANSFYWMNYMTPKRGDNDHNLQLSIKNNSNTGDDSYIEGTFNSAGFYSVDRGVFVNASESNPYGIEEINLGEGDTVKLDAITYLGQNAPSYNWSVDDQSVAEILQTTDPGSYSVKLAATGSAGDQTLVEVSDLANGLQKSLTVNLVESSGTTDGLVAWYGFNNGSVDDKWGNFDGNNYGAEPATDFEGNQNEALEFYDYAYVAFQPSPLGKGAKTVSFMYRPNEIGRRQVIITNTPGGQASDYGFQIIQTASNNLFFSIGNGSDEGHYLSAQTSLQMTGSDWHHLAMVFSGNELKGYVDGQLSCLATGPQGSEATPSAEMRLGGPLEPLDTFLTGIVDELRLYDKALSETEIQDLQP